MLWERDVTLFVNTVTRVLQKYYRTVSAVSENFGESQRQMNLPLNAFENLIRHTNGTSRQSSRSTVDEKGHISVPGHLGDTPAESEGDRLAEADVKPELKLSGSQCSLCERAVAERERWAHIWQAHAGADPDDLASFTANKRLARRLYRICFLGHTLLSLAQTQPPQPVQPRACQTSQYLSESPVDDSLQPSESAVPASVDYRPTKAVQRKQENRKRKHERSSTTHNAAAKKSSHSKSEDRRQNPSTTTITITTQKKRRNRRKNRTRREKEGKRAESISVTADGNAPKHEAPETMLIKSKRKHAEDRSNESADAAIPQKCETTKGDNSCAPPPKQHKLTAGISTATSDLANVTPDSTNTKEQPGLADQCATSTECVTDARVLKSASETAEAASKLAVNLKTRSKYGTCCKLCRRKARFLCEHVWQFHMPLKRFQCERCPEQRGSVNQMRKHAAIQHQQVEFIYHDRSLEYPGFLETYDQCFELKQKSRELSGSRQCSQTAMRQITKTSPTMAHQSCQKDQGAERAKSNAAVKPANQSQNTLRATANQEEALNMASPREPSLSSRVACRMCPPGRREICRNRTSMGEHVLMKHMPKSTREEIRTLITRKYRGGQIVAEHREIQRTVDKCLGLSPMTESEIKALKAMEEHREHTPSLDQDKSCQQRMPHCQLCNESVCGRMATNHIYYHLYRSDDGNARYACTFEGCDHRGYMKMSMAHHVGKHFDSMKEKKIAREDCILDRTSLIIAEFDRMKAACFPK